MSAQDDLVARVRAALEPRAAVEKRMFGGIAFMVEGTLILSAGADGDLLVRVAEERSAELLTHPGVRQGDMGGRSMGPRWLVAPAAAVTDDAGVRFWVEEALTRLALASPR